MMRIENAKGNRGIKPYFPPAFSPIFENSALFRNKRFALNEMFQRNASKFAIFYA